MATTTDLQTYDNFVDGDWVAPADGATEAVINPATGEELARAPLSSAQDVDAAVTELDEEVADDRGEGRQVVGEQDVR